MLSDAGPHHPNVQVRVRQEKRGKKDKQDTHGRVLRLSREGGGCWRKKADDVSDGAFTAKSMVTERPAGIVSMRQIRWGVFGARGDPCKNELNRCIRKDGWGMQEVVLRMRRASSEAGQHIDQRSRRCRPGLLLAGLEKANEQSSRAKPKPNLPQAKVPSPKEVHSRCRRPLCRCVMDGSSCLSDVVQSGGALCPISKNKVRPSL